MKSISRTHTIELCRAGFAQQADKQGTGAVYCEPATCREVLSRVRHAELKALQPQFYRRVTLRTQQAVVDALPITGEFGYCGGLTTTR